LSSCNSADPQLSRADDHFAGIKGNSPRGNCRESCESARPAILNSIDGIVGDFGAVSDSPSGPVGSIASLIAT
jgi:hypothetical protein